MRRLTIALLVTFLLTVAVGHGVVAQSPVASFAALDQRVEISEPGYTVSFPSGWVVETIFGESHAVSPDGSARCDPNAERFDDPLTDPSATLDEIAAIYPNFSDDGPLPIIETSDIELPAGRAIRFVEDRTLDPDFDEGDGARYRATYLLTDGLTLIFLDCEAPERPEDDWLSVAETIEFLPVEVER